MDEHSKLPFRAAQHNDTAWAVLSGDIVIAIMDRTDSPELNKPNAEYVVRACNGYKDMLTALQLVKANYGNKPMNENERNLSPYTAKEYDMVKAAIDKATT